VGASERAIVPVPFGRHVYVLSDLALTPRTSPSSRPVREFIDLLGDIDDPAVVVVAGNLLHPSPDVDLAAFIDATWTALAELASAITAFCARPDHLFYVIPGADDLALRDDDAAQRAVEALGVRLARELIVQVATAQGSRDLAIAAGSSVVDTSRVDPADRADAERLEDPTALERFVASRVLYRRLGAWIWAILIALALVDLAHTLVRLFNHFTHHHLHVRTLHTHSFWGNFIVTLFAIIVLEALVAGAAALLVRRRFNHGAHVERAHRLEPLALTTVDDVDALEYARRVAERGGAGAIVGGAPSPALAFLDRGMCATPGPSRTVVIERRGRLGLPPVFSAVRRLGVVEVEAASAVQVRLLVGQSPHRRHVSVLERLIGGTPWRTALSEATTTVGSWPTGDPFPMDHDALAAQRRERAIRRVAAGLLALDGLINVVVTVRPILRTRLNAVLAVLPLDVARSAAAVTALAGIGLIMLARGVRRGQRRAWFLALATLAITTVAHLARGGSVASSLVAVALIAALLITRDHFRASTDRVSARTALPRLGAIAVVAVVAAALGIEASARHQHLPSFAVVLVGCTERLIGQTNVSLPDRVNDFFNPVLLTVGVSLVVSALYLLTRPVVDRRLSATGFSAERRIAERRAREIVRRHGRGTLDYFALRDDKQFFFFRDSLVAYAVYGGVALISPDPIGPVAERGEVFSAFRAYAEHHGWTIGVMGAGEDWLPLYRAAGLHYLYIGDEAIVDCATFSLEGGRMKGLRQARTRLVRHGYRAEFLDPASIDPALVVPLLDLITKLRRGETERGFSMMLGRLFDPRDKGLLLTVVFGPDDRPAAVCQFVPSPAIHGYSLDLMRRDPGDHPNGLIDFALCSTIEYLRERGGRGLSLNFAAFRSVLESERGEGTFTRVERWALRRLSGVLPIESLWSFNAKYYPTWLPRHLVYPAAENFVPVVLATLRAESLTEIPVVGRLLANDPANRPGTVVPDEVLSAARRHR
jgi:lysylphosphatidylglycerol synthetase-like protein (DUF2156 family)